MTAISARVSTRRWWDIPAAILLFAAIITASVRLAATNWTEDLALIQFVAAFGLFAGLALGQSTFSRTVVVIFTLLYGLFIIGLQLGLLIEGGVPWSERIPSVAGRLFFSASQLAQRKPVTDPMLFLGLMALIFWLLSAQGGYSLTRHGNTWQAALPIGLAMFIIHIHDPYWPYRAWFLATYIFFALLLLARMTYLHSHARWQQSHTRLPPYLGLDLIRITLLVTAVLVLLAWTFPALASSVPLAEQAWRRLSRPWTVARSRMTNAFASLRASVGLVYDYYGDSLPLGRGNNLTDNIIMTIKAPPFPDTVRRFYWRARVYDTYEDGLWTSTYDESIPLTPENFELNQPVLTDGRWSATLDMTTWVPLTTLFVIPQPEWVSRPVLADTSRNPDGTLDLAALHASQNLQAGETYQVRSSISAVTESAMRASSTTYPDWVEERYLQLPDTITDRTYELARNLSSGQENPYDKTVAVIEYLRDTISYTNSVPVPPTGQDPVDWVLFELQEGFCNYYSSSAIVLLRAMGIPARWAVGYAQGEYDAGSQTYTIRQREAHSWPEVFFTGIGWVEFEPTLSQPQLVRPVGSPDDLLEDNPFSQFDPSANTPLNQSPGELQGFLQAEGAGFGDETAQTTLNILLTALLVLASLGLIGFAVFAARSRRKRGARPIPQLIESGFRRLGIKPPKLILGWSRVAGLPPVSRAYNEINRGLARLGLQPGAGNTPAERAAAIGSLLPSVAAPAENLVLEYQRVIYGAEDGNVESAQQNARTIWKRSWLARLNRLLYRFQEK
ncbi:MAG TPA: transglutaminase-like domain-containing protein [Anaerolineales bacterium]|nr:transglutaminase-like domain-containing protein [Anaerolineales bacterium]